jgi:dTMP kinase
VFITFEGIDRSGKTTQAAMLARALGPEALLLREPGGTEVGEGIRGLLKDPGVELGAGAELLLFCAARAELARQVIAPAIADGRDVVCDRYIDSTIAYQAAAVGELWAATDGSPGAAETGIELVESLNRLVVGRCLPDLTVLIRIDPETAARRGQQRLAAEADRFEGRGIEFQRAVAAAYEELAGRHPERIMVVEATGSEAEIHEQVLRLVEERRAAGPRARSRE